MWNNKSMSSACKRCGMLMRWCWWVGKHNGTLHTTHSSYFHHSLVEGSTSVPIFLPFKAPTPPIISQSAIWTKDQWMARCARSKSMFSCLCNSYVCLCLSVLWFPFSFVFVNLNYQNLHCMLHAIIGFSMCTRVRGAFICLHIYISSVHACMHHQENKIKGSFSTYKKNLRILMQIWMKIFRSFEM